MFLTLFYMIATWMKAWQLRSIRTKLLEHISADSCVAFYKVPDDVEECSRACSSLCVEPKDAHIAEVLVVRGAACACALRPAQSLDLTTWRAPPPSPARLALLPHVARVSAASVTQSLLDGPSTSKGNISATDEVSVLLEFDLGGEDIVELNILPDSEAWRILAWRVGGSRLALALRGDVQRLASLAASFLSSNGPLDRLQTVKFEGTPISLTNLESIAVSRPTVDGSPRHRAKYVAALEKISENLPSCQLPPSQNIINHTKESVIVEEIKIIEIVEKTDFEKTDVEKPDKVERCDKIDKPEKVTVLNVEIPVQIENGESSKDVNEKPKPNKIESNGKIKEDLAKKSPLILRKSDLKLELNNKSAPEKAQPKTVTLSSKSKTTVSHKKTVTKTLGKKSSSKSSLLDEPIAAGEKSNRGGASCPSLPIARPPNILVYSDSAVTRENIARTLRSVLDPDRYAVYCTGDEGSIETAGPNGASLLVAGGALPPRASAALLNSLLGGARVLSLCSDLLLSVLPYYRTAEVRERELVSFTYEKWKSVKLLHHVFCYQASPAKRQFSAAPTTHPTEYKGHGGHTLRVEVLAAEQTWHTPSLLQATDDRSGGTAVFSQVHLELDAREYLTADGGSAEIARLGVLRKLLGALGLATASSPLLSALSSEPQFTPAFFLGTYERKLEAAESVAVGRLQLVQPRDTAPSPSATLTPLLLHACPENFSTLMYFQELRTNHLGRLVVYSEILTSTQEVINEQTRVHGLVIMADRQTKGHGRGGTVWLSPPGCMMFSLQVHTKLSEGFMGSRAALLQHLAAVAFVSAVRDLPGYQDLDLRIKWPNDIYYGHSIKLGGLILNTNVTGDHMVFNIGIGINLDNSNPTSCLNILIKQHKKDLAVLEREKLLAIILNRLEELFDQIQTTGNFSDLYDLYYKYWLHSDQEVRVVEEDAADAEPVKCRIVGIDESGYLRAAGPNGEITLRPDGNTFDMMKGLIAPKPKV